MNDDIELLRRYVENCSEAAFTELVHRRIGLVYSTALRRTGGDVHLAEDITQTVFTDLARKATSLRDRTTLTAWLYVSTHHAAAAAVRREQRRKLRETESHTMQTLLQDSAAVPDPQRLRIAVEDLICDLREDEREAIALRFFQQCSFSDVGAALRLSEEAARKRVERALEKIRTALARRGITSTSAVLALTLGELGAAVGPVGLAAKIAGGALVQAAAVGIGATLASFMMPGIASIALLAGGFAVSQQHWENQRLEASLAELAPVNQAIANLRAENRQLAHTAAETNSLRRIVESNDRVSASFAKPLVSGMPSSDNSASEPTTVNFSSGTVVTVQPEGTISWGDEPVTLGDFLKRLAAVREHALNGESTIAIRGLAGFSQLEYIIEEVRKAQITHVVVQSEATPEADRSERSWF